MNRISLTLAAGALAALTAPAFAHDGGAWRADFAAARDAAFKQADVNGDGKLTPDEFANFQQIMKQNMAAARFARLDANGDGVITADELANAPGHHGGCKGK